MSNSYSPSYRTKHGDLVRVTDNENGTYLLTFRAGSAEQAKLTVDTDQLDHAIATGQFLQREA